MKTKRKENQNRTKYLQLECNLSNFGMQQVSEMLKTGGYRAKSCEFGDPDADADADYSALRPGGGGALYEPPCLARRAGLLGHALRTGRKRGRGCSTPVGRRSVLPTVTMFRGREEVQQVSGGF